MDVKFPGAVLLEDALRGVHSTWGISLTWPHGKGRFPMKGERLCDTQRARVYVVSIGTLLRYIAKCHDVWVERELNAARSSTNLAAAAGTESSSDRDPIPQ